MADDPSGKNDGAEQADAPSPANANDTGSTANGTDRPKRGRPRKKAGFELVLTVSGSEDGTSWNAEVTQGGKRLVTGLPIPAAAVSAAAKDLHPDISDAIESVLSSAREQHRARVEQLQAELEAAQRALADLAAE